MNEVIISIFDVIQKDKAVDPEEGVKLFNIISKELDQNNTVVIDFKNIKYIITFFLLASVGQLYDKYPHAFIKAHLRTINATDEQKRQIAQAVHRAKEYFK